MLARTIMALIMSVPYGIVVSLMTLPMVIAILVTVVVLSLASPWVAVIAGLCSLVFQAVIYAQSARYAAMLTGLQRIADQPRFLSAMGRTLVIIGIVGVFSALVMAAALVVLYQFGADTWWWMDRKQLALAIQSAMRSPARGAEIFSFENMNIASLLFVIEAISMFFITLIGLFAVPRATDTGRGFGRAYTLGLILTRFLIAFPLFAVIAAFLSRMVLNGVTALADVVIEDVGVTASILYTLEIFVFTAMIFTFETLLLRKAHTQEGLETREANTVERLEEDEFRAIRTAWSERR